MRRRTPILVKFGGELLEEPRRLRRLAKALVAAETGGPIVVVHGGGREVDAEMAKLGMAKRAVDGLRITDAATLDVVVGVLAGRVNTRLVAAIGAAGDARWGSREPMPESPECGERNDTEGRTDHQST